MRFDSNIFLFILLYLFSKVVFLRDVTVGIRAKILKIFWKKMFWGFWGVSLLCMCMSLCVFKFKEVEIC